MSTIRRRTAGVLFGRQRGQGLMEYGLVVALISLFAVIGLVFLGPAIASLLPDITMSL